ncbi:putative inactive tRNA-specific adenosine deaminase-like protein 3 [Astathelohania contejeani]|uniref:Inactive tRNA-specific adenosine deaminase-like protein 3 n=1 Tax=Astathelohania contejeani TaxID=164912 RepID=A0ABQ7HYA5_9MICR|nr:putative inactive tRNA-specific adenosine deaminase-like protein 3 [Thelohania contejeani]
MFKRLLRREEERDVELIEGAVIRTPKIVSSILVEKISKLYALPSHLKRIKHDPTDRNFLFILISVNSVNNKNIENLLKNETLNSISISNVSYLPIPKYPPVTNTQFSIAKEIWPCKFYPIKDRFGYSYSNEYFKNIIEILKKNISNNACCSETCLIIDPSCNSILSIENDEKNILKHAIFKSVTEISKRQIGYLCSGFDAFLYNEPCIACAMALIHSRIRNVFLIKPGSGFNRPYSDLKLSYNEHLNHRYDVFILAENFNKFIF